MQVAIEVLKWIGTAITILVLYKGIFIIGALFGKKKFKKAKTQHTYGICIPARNENIVIKNLLDSIANQDYPMDKLRVFVVADNCTDNTADIAREFGAAHPDMNITVYEHNNKNERTKGFALKYLFEKIEEDFNRESFDGYFIFDADNVLRPNYISKMNDAFDEGNKIVVSFRHSKNMNQNWISFSYAMHWMRICFNENRFKAKLNIACRIQGTGFMFANEIVKDGWKYTSLTEDRAFCSDAVVNGYVISYCEEAVFFDEQPTNLKIALRQRLRWSKGNWGATLETGPKLLKNIFAYMFGVKPRPKANFRSNYEMFFINFPFDVESFYRKVATRILQYTIAILAWKSTGDHTVSALVLSLFISFATGWLGTWLVTLLNEVAVLIAYRKEIDRLPPLKTIFHMLMFPFFDIIGKFTANIAVFAKVEWKPIPHNTVIDINSLPGQNSAKPE